MKRIKYLHVMTHPSMFFNGNVIDMINSNNEYFEPQDHLFLVGYDDIFQKYKKYKNVKLIPKIMSKNYFVFISFSKNADFIFLHQNWFYDYIRLIFTPINIRKKYIWCVWGHDLYTNFGRLEGIKERVKLMARKIGDVIINYEAKYYYAIGIGFKYDALEIKSRFKNNSRILLCPYPTGIKIEQIDKVIGDEDTVDYQKSKPIKIMVAHSAHEYLHHKQMLDKLSVYKDENITVSLPLVYGNDTYAKKIEEYAKNIFGDKIEVLYKRMDEKDYLKYLNSVDVAVFDQIHQSGLGNIYYLLYTGKKIYLNKNGILKSAFLLESIYLDTTEKLGFEPYEKFLEENPSKDRAKMFARFILNEKNQLDMWKSTFNILQ